MFISLPLWQRPRVPLGWNQASPGRTRTLAGPGPRFANVHSARQSSACDALRPRGISPKGGITHMPITVLNNVFHLRSGGASLLMQVTPAGRLVHLYYGHLLPVGNIHRDFPPASAGPATSPTPPDDDCIDSVGTALFEYRLLGWGISGRRPSGRSGRTGRPSPTCATSPTGFPGASPASPASRPPTLPRKRRRRWKST